MHPIIYDVAVSADGFISGGNEDISAFPTQGRIVDDYLERLAGYRTAVMGRATYEFGYRFGLEPGTNPYPSAKTIVVSRSLELPPESEVSVLPRLDRNWIDDLRRNSDGPIYLCGGGNFAAAMLGMGGLDVLRLKRAPIILGAGKPLFARLDSPPKLQFVSQTDYGKGFLFQEFRISHQT